MLHFIQKNKFWIWIVSFVLLMSIQSTISNSGVKSPEIKYEEIMEPLFFITLFLYGIIAGLYFSYKEIMIASFLISFLGNLILTLLDKANIIYMEDGMEPIFILVGFIFYTFINCCFKFIFTIFKNWKNAHQ